MNPRTIARILLAVVLVFGAIGIGVVAYNAGVAHGAAAQVVSDGGNVVVAPGAYAVAPYAGWGWGWGFGNIFFGFFGFLIFLFLFFGLIRLAFGSGRGGWGRHGSYAYRGPNGWTDGEGRLVGGPGPTGPRRVAPQPPGHARLADHRRPGRLTTDSPPFPSRRRVPTGTRRLLVPRMAS